MLDDDLKRLLRGDHLWERGVCSVVGFSFQIAG